MYKKKLTYRCNEYPVFICSIEVFIHILSLQNHHWKTKRNVADGLFLLVKYVLLFFTPKRILLQAYYKRKTIKLSSCQINSGIFTQMCYRIPYGERYT